MRALLWLGVLVSLVVAGAGSATAAPVDLSAGEREIDDAVCQDFRRAAKWNLAWTAGGFTGDRRVFHSSAHA